MSRLQKQHELTEQLRLRQKRLENSLSKKKLSLWDTANLVKIERWEKSLSAASQEALYLPYFRKN